MTRVSPILFCFMITMLLTLSATAGNGLIDILPDGAVTLEITKSGSYVLVGNVTMSTNVTCIDIKASDVVLDLNGHTLKGSGSGTGAHGIIQSSGANASVLNGTVLSFAGDGIKLGMRARVRNTSGCLPSHTRPIRRYFPRSTAASTSRSVSMSRRLLRSARSE